MDDELRREMESHRALMGDPRAFGNTLRLRDEARDAWGWRWLDDFVKDTRFALRTLRHSPGFALTAVLTLALGIGVNIGMFTIVNALLLRPVHERSGEVVGVYSRSTTPDGEGRGISYPNYLDIREGTTGIFTNLSAFSGDFEGLDAGDGARRSLAYRVTADYFQFFGLPLALGRPFSTEEARLGADSGVAIVSHAFWEQRGADPTMVGRTVRVNGEPFTVIGVAAKGFTGGGIPGPEVWMPLAERGARDAHFLTVLGRLRAGTSIETAAPTLTTVARRLEQAYPEVNAGYTLQMSPPGRLLFMPGPGSGAMMAMLAVVLMIMPAIVLLVACLNLADLLLARGLVRRQELAIRSSLGGGRWRLTRQLLTEGLLLASVGGVVGLLLSTWATDALLASLRPVIPVGVTLPEFDLDWRVPCRDDGVQSDGDARLRRLAGVDVDRSRSRERSQTTGRRGRTQGARPQDRQCPGDRPGRALAPPDRDRRTVHDERDLRCNRRPGVSHRRRIGRGNRSGPGRVRRGAGKASATRVSGSPANGPGRGSRQHRIAPAVRRGRES